MKQLSMTQAEPETAVRGSAPWPRTALQIGPASQDMQEMAARQDSWHPEEKMRVLVFSNRKTMDIQPLPKALGSGGLERIRLPSGLRLLVTDISPTRQTTLSYGDQMPCWGFGVCLSGHIAVRAKGCGASFHITSGQSAFFTSPSMEDYTETVGAERTLRISVAMDQELLHAMDETYPGQLPRQLFTPCSEPIPLAVIGQITPAMRAIAAQIQACPYQGVTRQLFLEGKSLELFACKMHELSESARKPAPMPRLTAQDKDRVHHAARLLVANLEEAPSLGELARAVGMCRSKLHHCFQEVFGATPFDYLRVHRLEAAERMLREGAMNVTEAALSVGYTSLSHFTKVFSNHFGFLPGQCLKGRRSVQRGRSRYQNTLPR